MRRRSNFQQGRAKLIRDLIISDCPESTEDLPIKISSLTGLAIFRSPRQMSSADVHELLKEHDETGFQLEQVGCDQEKRWE